MSEKLHRILKAIIAKVFEIDAHLVSDDFSSDRVNEWNSMRHIRMIFALEEELGVIFDPEEIPNLVTYKKLFAAVDKKLTEMSH
jgi:acyl carrier protein